MYTYIIYIINLIIEHICMIIPVGKWCIDLYKKLSNLCIGTCLLEPNVATRLGGVTFVWIHCLEYKDKV